jgi:hypothetical protein
MAETQQIHEQLGLRMEDTQRLAAQTHRLARRVQGFALILLGLSLLGAGVLIWQYVATRDENAAQIQALRADTQTLLEWLMEHRSP